MTSSARLRTEAEERLRFETLVADISSRLANAARDQTDCEVQDALGKVSEFCGLGVAAIWTWSSDMAQCMVLTHLHQSPAEPAMLKKAIFRDKFPWFLQRLAAGRTLCVSSPDTLPIEAACDLQFLRKCEVTGLLAYPLMSAGRLERVLSFHTTGPWQAPSARTIKRIELLSHVIGMALEWKVSERNMFEAIKKDGPVATISVPHPDSPDAATPGPAHADRGIVFSGGNYITARETEIIRLLAGGLRAKEAAAQLGVSTRTIEAHRANLMRKLGLRSTVELVLFAVRKEIIKVHESRD